MKNFLYKLMFFVFPLFLILLMVELYIRNSNTAFITKATYFDENKDKTEVLILGTSHNQNGVNPKFFRNEACNLSYASQNIQLDSAVFFSGVKKMPNLKKVIFEMDYHRLDLYNFEDKSRLPWYYIYYGIEILPINWINKYSLYSSNPAFFNNVIYNDFANSTSAKVINKYGFVEKNFNNEFINFNYDSLVINAAASKRLKSKHKEFSDKAYFKNKKIIIDIIKYCKENNIELYFFSTPLYKTYLENKLPKKEFRFKNLINDLRKNYRINYYNFENNPKFKITDFSNEDHLNPNGAEKYSKIMDSIINR